MQGKEKSIYDKTRWYNVIYFKLYMHIKYMHKNEW